MQWTNPSPHPRSRWRLRTLAGALLVGLVAALSLATTRPPESANGLGILPRTQSLLEQSGVTLHTPHRSAHVSAAQAESAATAGQSGALVDQVLLAVAVGSRGSAISPPGKLCWVVFLNPAAAEATNPPAPGVIHMDTVLVDAHTGTVIEGFISFGSTTPNSKVGSE
ncbi:MAG: hypothetical protein WA938_07280 [Candidatus Dormiibacterota bacterium]